MTQPPNTIHYSQLPPSRPDDPAPEWETFRREVGRLIAEGHEGKWVLLRGDQIIGLFDTEDDAKEEGYRRYMLTGFNVQHVATYQPLLRSRAWYWYQCPTQPTP
jgi:hypothetical protein